MICAKQHYQQPICLTGTVEYGSERASEVHTEQSSSLSYLDISAQSNNFNITSFLDNAKKQHRINTFNKREGLFTDNNANSSTDYFPSLHIGSHNINGLGSDKDESTNKFSTLIRYMKARSIDIFIINETNITQKEGTHLTNAYNRNVNSDQDRIFAHWIDKHDLKHKGSGVAIIINSKWHNTFT